MKEKVWAKDLIAGIFLGIGFIIPGFSGGTMAVALGIYNRLIAALANVTKHPLKALKDLLFIIIGVVIGALSGVFAIINLFEKLPVQTTFFFVGLILGSLPGIFNKTKQNNKITINWYELLLSLFFLALIIGMPLISQGAAHSNVNIWTYISLFGIGILCSVFILPSLSGSMILMIFGYYAFLLDIIKQLLYDTLSLNFTNFFANLGICLAFGAGLLLGMLFLSKLINYLNEKHPHTMNWIILSLLIASPFAIMYASWKGEYASSFQSMNVGTWIVSILVFLIGASLTIVFEIYGKKHEAKKTILIEENKPEETIEEVTSE